MQKLTFLFLLLSTTLLAQTDKSRPFVLGVTDEIQSVKLSENRILNIYLPEGYSKTDTTRYPVVYLLDGAADEDFIHVVGLFQFNNFPWIDQAPKSIVVGIANTDRKRDFTFPSSLESDKKLLPTSGGSERFIAFIEQELQPFIERKYRGNGQRMLIGQSLGGLLATEILLKKPAMFNKYMIISPSLWWNDGSLLRYPATWLTNEQQSRLDIYIGVGKEGLAPSAAPHVMEVDANVLAEKIRMAKSKSVHSYFDYLPMETHATASHPAVFNALRWLYRKG